MSNLEHIDGRSGNFAVSIRERARFVTDACTRCKLCHKVCPVVLANEYDADLTYRKAIFTPMSETLPPEYVIDIGNCLNKPPNYLPCRQCVDVCDDDAIHFDMPLDSLHEVQVGAVILAPGFEITDGSISTALGYGMHPDIVTSGELQRLLESPGPTGGYASKPSDEEYPDSVLLVLEDPSPFALYIVASQVHQLLDQDIEKVVVLVLSQLSDEKERAEAERLGEGPGFEFRQGAMFKVDPEPDNGIAVSFEDLTAKRFVTETYDMVVLCSDVWPAAGLPELAETVGIKLAGSGYVSVVDPEGGGVATSQDGVFVAGCASGPKNITDSIATARAAAVAALACLDQRLLRADYTAQETRSESQPGGVSDGAGVPLSEDETRARIEKMLYALLDQ